MGIFTWTDATIKKPRCKDGWYDDLDVVMYGGYVKLVCPDNTVYESEYYDGYGHVGSVDVYEKVVEWNREDILKIITKRIKDKNPCGLIEESLLFKVASLFRKCVKDEDITDFLSAEPDVPGYFKEEWKRNLGIAIACEDEYNKMLRYPIKLTRSRGNETYQELYRSYATQ